MHLFNAKKHELNWRFSQQFVVGGVVSNHRWVEQLKPSGCAGGDGHLVLVEGPLFMGLSYLHSGNSSFVLSPSTFSPTRSSHLPLLLRVPQSPFPFWTAVWWVSPPEEKFPSCLSHLSWTSQESSTWIWPCCSTYTKSHVTCLVCNRLVSLKEKYSLLDVIYIIRYRNNCILYQIYYNLYQKHSIFILHSFYFKCFTKNF